MRKIALEKGWRVKHLGDLGEGKIVDLPHDAMIGEKRDPESLGGINTGWFEGYDYEYTYTLKAEETWKNVVLECEGVYHNAEVYLNDERLMFRPYGYTNFYVPLPLEEGNNTIRIIARNADQPNSRWYSGAGLYRMVNLWVAEEDNYIPVNGIKVKTLNINPAVVEVSCKTIGSGGVKCAIEKDGVIVKEAQGYSDGSVTFRMEIENAEAWSVDHPVLYACKVTFGALEESVLFGVRTLAWGKEGLCMNGERVILKGACIHHDNGILGAACYPEAVERKIRLLKSVGYNAVRSAHNPCSKTLLEVCDRLGMLVMDEYIDHWYIHKTQYDYVDYFNDWWKQDLREMVEKDYNHPCVVLYSTGNEVSETAQPKGIALTKEMTEFLHGLDDTRPVTCGVNIFFNLLSSLGFGVYSDEKAQKEVAGKKKKAAVGSQFFNDLAGMLGAGFMKTGATLHGCDVKTREAFANMDIAGYNYGIKRYKHDLKKYPDRLILGSETFCSDAYQFMEMAKDEPRLIGDFVWAGMDYLGEVGVGSWEYSDYAETLEHEVGWITAGSGRIDLVGNLLAEAEYTKVAFGIEDKPVIAVRPVNHTHDKHSPSAWKMTNAITSWSWHGFDGGDAVVEVYSREPYAELFVNGKSVGKKKRGRNCLFMFHTKYQSGEIEVKTYGKNGNVTGENKLVTAGMETVLKAEAEEPYGNLVFVNLSYTDQNGILKPLEKHTISLKVENGELVALGNACPFNKQGYLDDKTETYWGKALAVIRPYGKAEVVVEDGVRKTTLIIEKGN